jgi:mannosylglycerate hydrolase
VRDGPAVAPGQVAVALTLLRCVEWLSRGDLSTRRGHAGPMEYTPEAQCQGHHEFDYALVPHSGEWQAEHALVLREAQAFNTPVRAVVTGQHPGQQLSRTALVEVEPRELVVSAIKRGNAGEGLIVRVYNPLGHSVEASLRPGVAAARAFVTNLHEEQREQLFWSGEGDEGHASAPVHVGMRAGEILTILFQ